MLRRARARAEDSAQRPLLGLRTIPAPVTYDGVDRGRETSAPEPIDSRFVRLGAS